MEPLELKKSTSILEKQLSKVKGQFTLNDASSMTGISVNDARDALTELMKKYVCRLVVTENGDMLYDFGSRPQRRGEKTWAERWDDIKEILWQGFQLFFKLWISIMLVVYFVIFVVLAIAVVIASSQANSNDNNNNRRDEYQGHNNTGNYMMMRMISEMFFALFRWGRRRGYNDNTYRRSDRHGYEYQKYEHPNMGNTRRKNFVTSVYDFVFGPPRVEIDPFFNEKEVAAFARQSNGVVVLPDFKALAGWDQEAAQAFMTQCVIKFNGEADVTEEGVLYANFEDLRRSVNKSADGEIEWFWDEYEAEHELTGNTTGRNIAIIGMNLINLLGGGIFLLNGQNVLAAYGVHLDPVISQFVLGLVPFLFALIFFAVPIFRYFNILPKERKRHRDNIRKRLVKVIYLNRGHALTLSHLLDAVNQNATTEEELDEGTIKNIMGQLVNDWGGMSELDPNGQMVYHFEQLQIELSEADRLRQEHAGPVDLGNTYLDTDNIDNELLDS